MDVLVIYQFCIFGGVERAILNRASIFKRYGLEIKISVGYLRDDGALDSFREYIRLHELENQLNAFVMPRETSYDWSEYDMVSIIDTPQILDSIPSMGNLFIECHTPYTENRQYLSHLPDSIKGILVPSEPFRSLIRTEFPGLPPIHVIPNPVSEEFYKEYPGDDSLIYPGRPLVYFARLDEIKNFTEAAVVFKTMANLDDICFLVIGYGAEDPKRNKPFTDIGLPSKTFLKEKIEFDSVPFLISLVKRQRGVFLSPSKGESFGLSAAEFICAGVPVLLSDIPPHRELVQGDENCLYELGDIEAARKKIVDLMKDWDKMSERMRFYGFKFQGDAFHTAWKNFMSINHLNTHSR